MGPPVFTRTGGLILWVEIRFQPFDRLSPGPAPMTFIIQGLSQGDLMRPSILAGIVIFGLGAYVLLQGASFTSKRDVLKVGDVKITADEKQSIPQWAGVAALVVGAVLVVSTARKRA